MGFGCPVCNGLRQADASCTRCGNTMEDTGRLENYFADYSPYREIDDLRKTNGYLDLETGHCIHVFFCHECKHEATVGIPEEYLPK